MPGASASSAMRPASPTYKKSGVRAHRTCRLSATHYRVADNRPLIDESLGRSGLAVAGAGELAAGAAVAVDVASASAWVLLEDHMRRCRASHRRASRESFS